jgi:preprotein translocase subunit SecB
VNGLALRVTAEQAHQAKRLMGLASLESVRLIHVRAAHMTAEGCPVKDAEEKPLPTATANLLSNTNQFRVVFRHVMRGRRESKALTEVQVDATFELVYSYPPETTPPPTPEELQAFADTNSLMNCWPYWRELVQNMVARMNLPPFLVPLIRYVSPKQKAKDTEGKKPDETKKAEA